MDINYRIWWPYVRSWWEEHSADIVIFAWMLFVLAIMYTLLQRLITHYQEKGMSRIQKRARRKAIAEEIGDTITTAVEEAVKKGNLERSDADAFYLWMANKGRPGLGIEPTYGKPWYVKIGVQHPAKVKAEITRRLGGVAEVLRIKRKQKEAAKKNRFESLIVRK